MKLDYYISEKWSSSRYPEILENRVKMFKEFNIKSAAKLPQYLNYIVEWLTFANLYDHPELYKNTDGDFVFIVSPYTPPNSDVCPNGWIKYDPIYNKSASTFIKVIPKGPYNHKSHLRLLYCPPAIDKYNSDFDINKLCEFYNKYEISSIHTTGRIIFKLHELTDTSYSILCHYCMCFLTKHKKKIAIAYPKTQMSDKWTKIDSFFKDNRDVYVYSI